ncbi:hypothetical protein pb186bvf_014292 [Paramecium bursaria]
MQVYCVQLLNLLILQLFIQAYHIFIRLYDKHLWDYGKHSLDNISTIKFVSFLLIYTKTQKPFRCWMASRKTLNQLTVFLIQISYQPQQSFLVVQEIHSQGLMGIQNNNIYFLRLCHKIFQRLPIYLPQLIYQLQQFITQILKSKIIKFKYYNVQKNHSVQISPHLIKFFNILCLIIWLQS